MAEVIHRYVGRGEQFVPSPPRQESKAEQERAELDAEWRRKRIDAESARQRLHEAKLLTMRNELISRQHVTKQSAFLILSLKAKLLALPELWALRLVNLQNERAVAELLGAMVRSVLDEIAELPLRVSDPDWLSKLEDELEQPSMRPKRVTK
jgi:hypothetical protein